MKKAVTFRFDAALLESARHCATLENRTLTNFIETLIKTHVVAQVALVVPPAEVLSPASLPQIKV